MSTRDHGKCPLGKETKEIERNLIGILNVYAG